MRPRHGALGALPLLFLLALPGALLGQTRTVSGTVVDAESGAPVADVLITIPNTSVRVVTDADGRFRLVGVSRERLGLMLSHVGYGRHPFAVSASGSQEYRIRISPRAIELSPMVVQVSSSAELARRASGNSLNVIERPTIEAYAARGEPFQNALREVPGIRVNRNCIEYRNPSLTTRSAEEPLAAAQDTASAPCRTVSIYIDGMWMQDGGDLLHSLSLHEIERIEILSPSEAGVRYMDAARGVLVVETRRGSIPQDARPEVAITGFGWDESEPYRWLRVLGVSALANGATMAIAYAAFDCGEDEDFLKEGPQCSEWGGMGAGILSGTVSGLVTRWVGGTDVSKGRTLPSVLLGTATATAGYMLRLYGENHGSSVHRTAGDVVLGVGVPLSLTLSDRVFRRLR